MAQYLANKRFFAQGTFFGLDELTHVHTLAKAGACVINCFNLEDAPATRTLAFKRADVGLPDGTIEVDGATSSVDGDKVILTVSVPAKGHQLVKVTT